MKRWRIWNTVFRGARFCLIAFLGYLVYKALFDEILTRKFHIFCYILLWFVSAYWAVPQLNKLLTKHYLPNYFIGRSRTKDGLLGDPVNLAFLGEEAQIEELFLAAGWTKAEPLSLRSSLKIVKASLLNVSYPGAPVSTLLLFDQPQQLAFEKEVDGNPRQRHHIRFWKTPDNWFLPGGRQADWLAAATYDRKVGISLFTGQITHKITADIDKERDVVLKELQATSLNITVERVAHFTTSYHSVNGGGDSIYTDGTLPFVLIEKE